MKFKTFELERNMSVWENAVDYNLSESGVHPLALKDVLTLEELEEISGMELYYTEANGTVLLRETVATMYPGSTPDHVLITNGSAEANFLCTMTLLEPGDELIYMVPNYLQIGTLASSIGVGVKEIQLRPELNWQMDLDELNSLVTPKTKMIAVCTPNNPTGAIMSRESMAEVRRMADEHDLYLLSDEVYRGAELSGVESPTVYSGREKDIVNSGLSKAYRLPGLRLGWSVTDPDTIWELWKLHDYTTISLGLVSDTVASKVLQPDRRKELLAGTHQFLKINLAMLTEWIESQNGLFSFTQPEAAAIAFPKYHLDISSIELIEKIRDEKSVLIMPGKWFGVEQHVRIGYGTPPDLLKKGLSLMEETLNSIRELDQA